MPARRRPGRCIKQRAGGRSAGGQGVLPGLGRAQRVDVERVEGAVDGRIERIACRAASTLSSRNGNWSSCQTPSQLFLRSV